MVHYHLIQMKMNTNHRSKVEIEVIGILLVF